MKIIIAPSNGWTLPVERVNLDVRSDFPLAFTAAWKAFERELIRNALKADIVQLNGYYQYSPKLCCKCWVDECVHNGNVLKQVLEGHITACNVSTADLAIAWDIDITEVFQAACFLKTIGYEVRNHSTNPQIDDGTWLIPYAFPTLTPLSVQLWKNL